MENIRSKPDFPIAGSALTTVLLFVVVIGALYFAREVLVPIALALLLSFYLRPWFELFGTGTYRALLR